LALFRDSGSTGKEGARLSSAGPQVVHPPSIIGPRTRVLGTISGAGPLTVRGQVEGKITLSDRLTLAPECEVRADVEAAWVELHGHLEGSVRALRSFRIVPPGWLEGDAVTPRARVELGAVIRGGLLIRIAGQRRPA
jgi:cytoskeletal protein CcmA (bactofilin family)